MNPKQKVNLYSPGATIHQLNDSDFLVSVSKTGNASFEVYKTIKGVRKTLFTQIFRAQVVGLPETRLGNARDSVLSVNEIIHNPFLHIVISNTCMLNEFTILSFGLTIVQSKDTVLVHDMTNGIQLTNSQLKLIRELSSDDQLIFDDVIVTCPDCQNFKMRRYRVIIR